EVDDLSDSNRRHPQAAFGIDRHTVGPSFRHLRKDSAILNAAVSLDVVGPNRLGGGVAMIEQLAVRTQPETVGDLDSVPHLGGASGRVYAKQAAWQRLVVTQRIEFQ